WASGGGWGGDWAALRASLRGRCHRHWRVNRTRSQARRMLAEMFQLFMGEPDVLPAEWFARTQGRDEASKARVICDYIAGMTDRYAIEEHRKVFHLDLLHQARRHRGPWPPKSAPGTPP